MAIKDQCAECCFYNETIGICRKIEAEPILDGSSCEVYQKNGIPLEKASACSDTSHDITDNSIDFSIHGWLMFFCFAIGLGSIVTFLWSIGQGDLYQDYGGSIWFKGVDVTIGATGLLIAAYAIFAICKRKKNAVFFAKSYVIMIIVTNLAMLLFNITDESSYMTSIRRTVSNLVWGVIWILYLIFSEQIKSRFPKNKRKVGIIDWVAVLSMIYIPLFCVLMFWLSGDNIKIALQQSVDEVNSEMILTEGFDSVSYNKSSNVYSYYLRFDDEDCEIMASRNDDGLKKMLLYVLKENYNTNDFLLLLKEANTTLRYVYQTSSGKIAKIVDIKPSEMDADISINQMREGAINMIAKEAEEVNSTCPQKIDDWLYWSSCTFDRQRVRMTLVYSLVYYDKREIDRNLMEELIEEIQRNIIESIRGNVIYKDAGLSLGIEFRDKNNELIDCTVISSNEY